MLALDLDGLELVVVDLDVDTLVDLVALALVRGIDRLAVTSSTNCWRNRLPVCLLICRNEIRSEEDVAGLNAIGHETSESLR
jgi:hypothetical protein